MPIIHRLSVKIALLTSVVVSGFGVLAILVLGTRLLLPTALVCGTVFLSTYAASKFFLYRRLILAHDTLRQIRKHQFESLEEVRLPRGDELSDLTWQVYRTGKVLEREIDELKNVESYRRVFIGNVSHELKTPIFSILGFAETLLNGAIEDGNVNRSFVSKIARNAERLKNLTRDLTEISRLETGELEMTFSPFDLGTSIREIVESLDNVASVQVVSLSAEIPDPSPFAIGDQMHLRQVLSNLVENALRYTNPGGNVVISVRKQEKGMVRISVTDDGIGLSEDHKARVTERFFRVDTSRSRSAGGTGLGLAIVKHILAAHNQTLQIDSVPGRGSTFSFMLPASSRTHSRTE